jgi:hypothetical protein
MKRIIEFGKVDYNRSGRRNCPVTVEIELTDEPGKGPVLSVCGNIWNPRKSDIYSGGQNLDEIAKFKGANPLFREVKRLWEAHHLNDMHAACVHQTGPGRDAGLEVETKGKGKKAVGWLRPDEHPAGILCKPCPVCGYKYGTAWLYREIPPIDLEIIKSIISGGEK